MLRKFVLLLCAVTVPAGAAELPAPWVELAADGSLSVRAIVAPGATCPPVGADGVVLAAAPRGAPDAAFPVQVCEVRAPAQTKRLAVGGAALPVLPAAVRRVVVI